MGTTNCKRCGQLGRPSVGNPDSRPFRKAAEGLCVNCVVTEFFKTTEPLKSMFGGIWGNNSPEVLLAPHMQQQFGNILQAGNCDVKLEEIDWQTIIDQWDLPFPKTKRKQH